MITYSVVCVPEYPWKNPAHFVVARKQRERHRKEGTGTRKATQGSVPVTSILATSSLSTISPSSYESAFTDETGAPQSPSLPTEQDLMENADDITKLGLRC